MARENGVHVPQKLMVAKAVQLDKTMTESRAKRMAFDSDQQGPQGGRKFIIRKVCS